MIQTTEEKEAISEINNKMLKEQPHTIVESIKQEGIKGFMKRWKAGFNKIPPEKLLEAELVGYWGTLLGTIAACIIFLIWSGMWPLVLVLGFNVIIQVTQIIGKYQALNQMKSFQAQFEQEFK